MITKFKIFETVNEGKPKIGDYVLLFDHYKSENNNMIDFINNNIGKIVFIDKNYSIIEYYNVPDSINYRFEYNKINGSYKKTFRTKFISHWSKNREDLEEIIAAKKFNL